MATSDANKWLLHLSFLSQSALYLGGKSYTYIFKSFNDDDNPVNQGKKKKKQKRNGQRRKKDEEKQTN